MKNHVDIQNRDRLERRIENVVMAAMSTPYLGQSCIPRVVARRVYEELKAIAKEQRKA